MMKSSSFFSVFLIAIMTVMSGCKEKKNALTVGSSIDYPPFEYFQNGEMTGFDVELVHEIGKRLDKEVIIKDMPFDAIIGALQTGRINMSVSSIAPTVERQKSVSFSTVYYQTTYAVVSHKKLPIKSFDELKEKVVGVQLGTIYENYLKESLIQKPVLQQSIIIRALTKVPDLIQDLKSGRITCIVMGHQEAKAVIELNTDLMIQELPKLESSTTTTGGIAIAFPKESPLVADVNKILEDMKTDGTLEALTKKWLS